MLPRPAKSHRCEVLPGNNVQFTLDGEPLSAQEGDTIAAALIACGRKVLRRTPRRSEPRGLFCGIGVCYECLMQVDGRPNVQACLTPVAEGMRVETQTGMGVWGSDS